MSKRALKLYLQDILTCISNIEDYIRGISFESFSVDRKTIDAVVRNLEIIGEAANNISQEFKIRYSNIP